MKNMAWASRNNMLWFLSNTLLFKELCSPILAFVLFTPRAVTKSQEIPCLMKRLSTLENISAAVEGSHPSIKFILKNLS